MKVRQFGRTDDKVSELILGSWVFGGRNFGPEAVDDSESVATIHAALDAGITMIDTAEIYGSGRSEEVVGEAIKGRRDKVQLATKAWRNHLTREGIEEGLAGSLKRLGTDYVDLYIVHWPEAGIPIEETMTKLAECREDGRVHHIGVSNFPAALMEQALAVTRFESLQPPYSLYWRYVERAEIPFCVANGISVTPYSPIAQGLLTGKFRRDHKFGPGDIRANSFLFKGDTFQMACDGVEKLEAMAAEIGCPVVHLALAWLLAQPGVTAPIVGARRPLAARRAARRSGRSALRRPARRHHGHRRQRHGIPRPRSPTTCGPGEPCHTVPVAAPVAAGAQRIPPAASPCYAAFVSNPLKLRPESLADRTRNLPMPATPMERIAREDAETGVRIMQLTSFPLMHFHQYCYGQWITPDAKTLLLFGYRELKRDAPVDLWRVNNDGTDLALVAENGTWSAIMPDGETVYYGSGPAIKRVPLHGGPEKAELVAKPEGAEGVLVSAVSPDGRYVFAQCAMRQSYRRGNVFRVVRLDTQTGKDEVIYATNSLMHLQLHDENNLLATFQPNGEDNGIWTFSFDCDSFRRLPFTRSTNHFASLGMTGKVVTTVHSQGKAIEIATPGGDKAEILAQGPGFWHPTCDSSGEWVLADTNWHDEGMYLVHAPSGRFEKLCHTGTSGGHPQWSHAHPRLAPDASYVVFDSDASGICHVHVAYIPEEMKERLRRG